MARPRGKAQGSGSSTRSTPFASQHEDQLPDAIKTAVQEATQIPELAVGKKAQQSSRTGQGQFTSQGLGAQEDQASGDH